MHCCMRASKTTQPQRLPTSFRSHWSMSQQPTQTHETSMSQLHTKQITWMRSASAFGMPASNVFAHLLASTASATKVEETLSLGSDGLSSMICSWRGSAHTKDLGDKLIEIKMFKPKLLPVLPKLQMITMVAISVSEDRHTQSNPTPT